MSFRSLPPMPAVRFKSLLMLITPVSIRGIYFDLNLWGAGMVMEKSHGDFISVNSIQVILSFNASSFRIIF